MASKAAKATKKRIFLSGPMNSLSDIAGQQEIADALSPKFSVYLAPIDGVEIRTLIELIDNPVAVSELFLRAALLVQQIGWANEIYQLLRADALVLNLDGRVPDEGAVVEASSAFMAGKPVILYKGSAVTFWNFFDNPMVAALDTDWVPVRELKNLPGEVARAIAKPPATKAFTYVAPPNVQAAYDFGAWLDTNHAALMGALKKAAVHLPQALAGLEPSMGSMQAFAEALISGTKTVSVTAARTNATHAKTVARVSRAAAKAAFG